MSRVDLNNGHFNAVRFSAEIQTICNELAAAQQKFKKFNSPHEGYAVIKEEVDELWDEVKKKIPENYKLRKEAIQIAAMAIRFLMDVCNE